MTTITDVAKLAGVSPGTVSRVMNGADNVRPDTRARVKEAVAQLNYRPNLQARSLRSKRTNSIALALPELTNYFWTSVARGVQDGLQAQGYNVLLCNTAGRPADYLETLESIVGRVDGMILTRRSESVIVAQDEPSSSAQSINSRQIPLVFIGQSQAATWNVDNVYSDSVSGSFALTQHLLRLGHQNIAVVTGRQSSSSARDRVTGYCVALAQAQIPIDAQTICWGEYDRKTAQRITDDLLDSHPETSAIVAASNEIAIGVIYALERRQLRVPQDIAVVCIDDFYPDSRFVSTMTVAAQSPYDLGLNAAQLLLDRLGSDNHLRPRTIVLPTRLIVRESCGGGQPAPFDVENTFDRVKGELITTLSEEEIAAQAPKITPFVKVNLSDDGHHLVPLVKSKSVKIRQALGQNSNTPTQSLVHIEYAVTNKALYRYVLEREPDYELVGHHTEIIPEDQVEFAQRTGIATIICRFPEKPVLIHPENRWDPSSAARLFDFPPLIDQLDFFDHYVRAVQNTGVGLIADFRSAFADTLTTATALGLSYENPEHARLIEMIADELFHYHAKVVQLICDRFADDLAFIIFNDCLAGENGLSVSTEIFEHIFSARIQHLLQSPQDHNLLTALYTPGHIQEIIPFIQRAGFDAVYPAQPELHDLQVLRETAGKLNLMGGIAMPLLTTGHTDELIETVSQVCSLLITNGDYAVGVAGEISDAVPYTSFLTLLHTLRSVTGT